jgi:hypothetical protein
LNGGHNFEQCGFDAHLDALSGWSNHTVLFSNIVYVFECLICRGNTCVIYSYFAFICCIHLYATTIIIGLGS